MAIIGDVFPENRRGSATGSLMTGFALASIAGVPLGLFFGTDYGWHIPFVALAIGGHPYACCWRPSRCRRLTRTWANRTRIRFGRSSRSSRTQIISMRLR